MSKFLKVPRYDFKDSRRFTVVLEDELHYHSDILKTIIVVPAGFETDGASVPKFYWFRIPPFGKHFKAAIIHDFLCDIGNPLRPEVNFKVAAKVFREALKVCGVGWLRRNTMYQAVRRAGPRFKAKD